MKEVENNFRMPILEFCKNVEDGTLSPDTPQTVFLLLRETGRMNVISANNSGRGDGKDNASASMAQIVASKRSENCLNSGCHIQS